MPRSASHSENPSLPPRLRGGGRLTQSLGSLRLAIGLLVLLASVLVLGTVVESWYDSQTANQLVYGTWWFKLLLGGLGSNILCAALKKRPWKRHQLGFLITHVGLLCLVSGGLITSWLGIHGTMVLIDNPSAPPNTAARTAHQILEPRLASLRIIRDEHREDAFSADFASLPVAWRRDEAPRISFGSLTSWLIAAAHPWRRSWSRDIDHRVSLSVVELVPHAQLQPFSAATRAIDAATFPAVQIEFTSPTTGRLPPRWIANHNDHRTLRLGPAMVEFIGQGWSKEKLTAFQTPTELERAADVRAVLQFTTDDEGRLHFRSFHGSLGTALKFESAGPVATSGEFLRLWSKMNFRFRVVDFLPNAVARTSVTAVQRPLGIVDQTVPAAVRCELTNRGDKREFWLLRTAGDVQPVTVGDETFLVGFNTKLHELDFAITLLRAEQTIEPGSELPATQACTVTIHDPSQQPITRDEAITLNAPCVHRQYKIFLTGMQVLGRDAHNRPITRCTLTVARDPGVRLKYTGAAMVACGIACMFLMRAYPLRRRSAEITSQETLP